MPNICMDTVVFYCGDAAQKKGLERLTEAINTCFPKGRPCGGGYFGRIIDYLSLPRHGLHTRGEVVGISAAEDALTLKCNSAWVPMWDAYTVLAGHFNVSLVMCTEECGSGIYVNTDTQGKYLATRYKAYFADTPEDASLLFQAIGSGTELYFDSEDEILRWFRENGNIAADTVAGLKAILAANYVSIHEFEDTYQS